MNFEIIDTPLHFQLHGLSSEVPKKSFGEVGMKLMNEMWQIVKKSNTATSGINHWVYLPNCRLFVGVELSGGAIDPNQLEPNQFDLQRYVKHVHIGPYRALPEKWKALKAELVGLGETIGHPSLEIYGHHCEDASKLETTILIGLTSASDISAKGIYERHRFDSPTSPTSHVGESSFV